MDIQALSPSDTRRDARRLALLGHWMGSSGYTLLRWLIRGHRQCVGATGSNSVGSCDMSRHHEVAVTVFILDIVGKIRLKIHGII
jgi:hypothetical protein